MFVIKFFFTSSAVTLFLFQFWKKLKDDYTQSQIFTTGFYSLLGFGAGSMVAANFLPIWWFWVSLAGGVSGLTVGVLRFHLRIFETLDAAIPAGLYLLTTALLANWYFGKSDYSLVGFILCFALIGFYKFLDTHYKKFSWYKSGRVGFSGLAVLGVFFVLRLLIAIIDPNVVSFAGKPDVFISGVLAFISFFTLFNLSREIT